MGFLNSLLLFGLLGALVPLVIHLLERRKVPRLEFPSLRFLLELNQRQMRRLNLRRLLLLLIRMLLIAVIGFLTSRPDFLDLGLVYALMNFIGMIAVLRFLKFGHFRDTDDSGDRS